MLDALVGGQYHVLRLIGRGGMGEVYLARDQQLGRKVAIKFLRLDVFGTSEAIDHFLVEARATARFQHPNIVTIHGVGRHEDRPFVVLEYVDGVSLRGRINAGPLGTKPALRIALGILQGVAEAHRIGILHRDLKPENVLIPKDGRVRVVDFGLATRVRPRQPRSDQADNEDVSLASGFGLIPEGGSPAYMAPEQWTKSAVTSATDVFSFGVLLYEMLAGTRPFRGDTLAELAAHVLSREPAPHLPESIDAPPQLRRALHAALSKEPSERPAATALRDLIQNILFESPGNTATEEGEAPYRGLLPFRDQHAHLFFGREIEVSRAVESLRDIPVLPIIGPSGAGKSSFVRAGLIPRLREQGRWIVMEIRPGTDPFLALAKKLLEREPGSEHRAPELALALEQAPDRLGMRLRALAAYERAKVLLFVDQVEEVRTLVKSDAVRREFMRALFSAADDAQDPVRVVLTMREDFLSKVAEDERARAALERLMLLRPPDAAALKEIIERPLARAGYRFEPADLATEMISAVQDAQSALPLVELTCLLLWERRDRSARLLRRSDYLAIGGVAAALAAHADGVLAGLGNEEQALARSILPRLVTPERTRRIEHRSLVLSGLPDAAQAVLSRLVSARLVLERRSLGRDDDAEVELVHEALIDRWRTLHRWIEMSGADLAMLDEVGRAAVLWEKRGAREAELWTLDAVFDARSKLERISDSLPLHVEKFLRASESHARRRGRLVRGAIILAVAFLTAALVMVYVQRERAEDARDAERALRAVSEREGAAGALARGDVVAARKKLRASLELADSLQTRALWMKAERESPLYRSMFNTRVTNLAFSRDGNNLYLNDQGIGFRTIDVRRQSVSATPIGAPDVLPRGLAVAVPRADRSIIIGTYSGLLAVVEDGVVRSSTVTTGPIWRLAIDPEDRWIAAIGADEKIRFFDLDAQPLRTLTAHGAAVSSIDVGKDGTLLSSGRDQTIRTWSHGQDTPDRTLHRPSRAIDARLIPGTKQLIAGFEDGTIEIFGESGDRPTTSMKLDPEDVFRIAVHPSGAWFVTTGLRAARFWRVRDLAPLGKLLFDERISAVVFDPSGARIAFGTLSGVVEVWKSANVAGELDPPTDFTKVTISPDGRRLATISGGQVWIADNASGRVVRSFALPTLDASIALGGDPALIAIRGSNGAIEVFELETGHLIAHVVAHDRALGMVQILAGGRSLATSGGSRRIELWSIAEQRLERTLEHASAVSDFATSGDKLVSATLDGKLVMWDLSSGRQIARAELGSRVHIGGFLEQKLVAGSRGQFGERVLFSWTGDERPPKILGPAPGFAPCLALSAARRTLIVAGEGGPVEYALDSGVLVSRHERLVSPNDTTCATDERGRFVAMVGVGPMVYDLERRAPLWRAPFFDIDPRGKAVLCTHRGCSELESEEDLHLKPQLEAAIVERARRAAASRDHATWCLLTYDDRLLIFDGARGEQTRLVDVPGAREVLAVHDRCLVLSKAGIVEHGGDGAVRTIDESSEALAPSSGGLLAAGGGFVRELDARGVERRRFAVDYPVAALADGGDQHLVGFQNGELAIVGPRGIRIVASLPEAANVVAFGPARTAAVGGFRSNVYLIELETGAILYQLELADSIAHLRVERDRLYAVSITGAHRAVDLRTLTAGRATLLAE